MKSLKHSSITNITSFSLHLFNIFSNNSIETTSPVGLLGLQINTISISSLIHSIKSSLSRNPSSSFNEEKVKNVLSTLANKQLYPLSVGGGDVITRTNLLWFWYVSEQYMQESDIKREEIEDGITYYVNRNLKLQGDINAINKFLLENSRMLPVRQYFDNEDNWFFPFMFIRWNIEFESIVTSWDEKLKTIIKHCI